MVGAPICNRSIPVRIGVVALGNTNANLKVEMIHTLGGLRSSTVKPASAHARIILQTILNECRKDCQCVMCNVAVVWKTQDRVFHIAFGSRRWKWSGNANQLTVFRRCVVKDVIAEDAELCSRSPTGRGVRLKPGSVRVRISSGILRDRDERKT